MQVRCPYCQAPIEVTKSANYTCAQCRAIFKVDLGDAAPPAPPAGEPAAAAPATPDSPTMKSDANAVKGALAASSSGASAAAPPAASAGGAAGANRPPEGARCARHPDVPAVSTCGRCGNFSCTTCSVSLPQGPHCPDCAARVRSDGRATPWDERRARGFVPAVRETIRAVLFTPTEFFRKMPREGGYESPIGFMMVMAVINMLASLVMVWGAGFVGFLAARPNLSGGNVPWAELLGQLAFQSCQQVICAPVGAIIGAFVGGAFLHGGLMITSSARFGYEASVRVYCFASSINVVQLVLLPVAGVAAALGAAAVGPEGALVGGGGILGLGSIGLLVWMVGVQTIALREVHETTTGKALVAVLAPFFLMFCCIGMLVVPIVLAGVR